MFSIDTHRRVQVFLLFGTLAFFFMSQFWFRSNSNDPVWSAYAALLVYLATAFIYWYRLNKYTNQPIPRRCPVCEYELVKNNDSDLCPECGLRFGPGEREQLWNERLRMLKGEPSEYHKLHQAIRSRCDLKLAGAGNPTIRDGA